MSRNYVLTERPRVRGDLSKSKGERFMACPEKFRRSYRAGEWEDSTEVQAVGILAHRVIEIETNTRFQEVKLGLRGSLDEPCQPEELLETLRVAVPTLDEPVPAAVISAVTDFLERCAYRVSLADAVAVEEPFSVDFGGRSFVGIFDVRRQIGDDMVELVDWKTGFMTMTDEELLYDLQAIGYLYAARRLYPKATRIKVTYEFLAREMRSTLYWTPKLDEAAELHMRDLAFRIEREVAKERAFFAKAEQTPDVPDVDDKIWPAKPGKKCADCGFRASCQPYENWVAKHGREILKPLDTLTLEQLGDEAIRSRDLEAVHKARRQDAYARIWERMGHKPKIRIGNYDFSVRSKSQTNPPSPSEVLSVLEAAGVPPEKSRQTLKTVIDESKLKEIVKALPKDTKKIVTKELRDREEEYSSSSWIEAREASDAPENPFA